MALTENPSIEQLRLLASIAETRSVSQTAKQFGVSQPSVSNRLKVFRDKGLLVTTRSNHVEFTAKGRALLPAIRQLLRHYDQIKGYVADRRHTPSLLRIATGSSASQFFLPAAIARMAQQFPEVEIQTQAARGAERIQKTAEGHYDLAIVSHDPTQIKLALSADRGRSMRVTIEELARQPLSVIARGDSTAGKQLAAVLSGQIVPLSSLCQWTLVGLDGNSGVRRQIEREFVRHNQQLAFGPQAAGWLAVKEYVANGLGVGVLPLALLSPQDQAQFVIRRLPRELCVTHYIIHREDAGSPYLDQFKAALKDAARLHQQRVEKTWQAVI